MAAMTLEQLLIFVAVAERGHITQGARDLKLTQSAPSAAIARSRHVMRRSFSIGWDGVLVLSPDQPWAKHRPDPSSALKSRALGLPKTRLRNTVDLRGGSAGLGVKPQDLIALELSSNEAVRAAVEAGAGVTIISKLVAASSPKSGSLVAVDIDLPKRRFFTLRHKERHVTHAAREFYGLVTDGLGGSGTASKRSTQGL